MAMRRRARGWDARLGWAYGLTADDAAVRSAALGRLVEAQRNVADAAAHWNDAWRRGWQPGRVMASRRYSRAVRRSLPAALAETPVGQGVVTWPGLPYALLYLEWEARHPQEWTRHAKCWGTKQRLIRGLAVVGHDGAVVRRLVDLIEIVVRRPYRCKDREYVRVARAIDSDDLRNRLATAAGSDSPWARRHAGYVLWLLERPEVPNTRRVWRSWLESGSA